MSFVEVLPVEPVIPTTRALLRARTAVPIAASAANASSGLEHGGRAAGERVLGEVAAAADHDEEVALLDRGGSRPATPVASSVQPARVRRPSGSTSAERERDHAVAPSERSASRATSRSSNGQDRPADLLALLVALAGDHDDVAGLGRLERALDRGAAVRLDLEPVRAHRRRPPR